MSPLYWAALVPLCVIAAWVVVRRPVRDALDDLNLDRAREQFRFQREGLEARFLSAVGRDDPIEKARWDEAQWRDDVVWARDRRSRRILALIGVTFDPDGFGDAPGRHSTALFEYRKGRWVADGRRLDEVRPHEACLGNARFEAIGTTHRAG